ncbi:MAG: hypothetical protein VYC34_03350 [Planctomycetota bacterium]|nr:hypothetical protein [Planctomycetota bacterium]
MCTAVLFGATGCGGYQLKGKVIEGDVSYIAIVPASDPRFDGPGIGSAELRLENNPDKLNRETIGSAVSLPDGSFSVPVDAPGAGVLLYDVGLFVRCGGYIGAEQFFRLPPSDKRLLVILQRGVDRRQGREETPTEMYERLTR